MSRILEKLADQHEERMINVLYRLENDVIREVTRATKGQLVSQRIALQLQPQIKKAIEKSFLNEADLIINQEYNKIAKEVLDNFGKLNIPKKFKSLSAVDLQTINSLKYQSFSGFEDIAERFLKVINDEVYQSTIAGRPFEDMVGNIRSHINGVYKQSNVTEINELVDFVNQNKFDSAKKLQVQDAIKKLHTQYASDRAGNNLRKYAGQIAHDSVMQFHGQFTVAKAKEAGIDKFSYTGTLVRDSREFCGRMLNRILTEKQIREIWNTQSWGGKSTGDPFIVRGGYRCRHTWLPTLDEIIDEIPKEPEVVEEVPNVINTSSLTNKIKLEDIKPVSNTFILNKLGEQFKENAKDGRYPDTSNGKPALRFRNAINARVNNEKYIGHIKIEDSINKKRLVNGKPQEFKWSEKDYGIMEAMMQELDELAIKYDVPKLRGINMTKKSNTVASMGDGVLDLNPRHITLDRTGDQVSKWKMGDSTFDRPFTADSYFENRLDKIRSTYYHEFGHHIHQNKYNNDAIDYYFPQLEQDLKKVGRFKGKGATQYSDYNKYEWFTENFALYELGKTKLVDPRFIKFLDEKVK